MQQQLAEVSQSSNSIESRLKKLESQYEITNKRLDVLETSIRDIDKIIQSIKQELKVVSARAYSSLNLKTHYPNGNRRS